MREIVLDTETTGLSAEDGHRIVEIGALELVNLVPTGKQLHLYINPQREIDPDAERVHGLSAEFLAEKPVFEAISGEFLDFIGDANLVIHNAPFDTGFLNAELARLSLPALEAGRIVDTLVMARRKFPGSPASLDALCRRFEIDNSHRDLHGALIDADLLAAVYIELKGGRQPTLLGGAEDPSPADRPNAARPVAGQTGGAGPAGGFDSPDDPLARFLATDRVQRAPRPHPEQRPEEKQAWQNFVKKLTDPIWLDDPS